LIPVIRRLGSVFQFLPVIFVLSCLVACADEHDAQSRAKQDRIDDSPIEALTGGHTRVVWVQDVGRGDDFYAHGDQLRLMGFDSRDGRGERALLPETGQYSKPLITPDGSRVVYCDGKTDRVFLLDWEGNEPQPLTTGRTLATWRDPETGRDWLYVGRDRQGQKSDNSHGRVVRLPLDDPDSEEPVWNTLPVNENNFQLSADGTRASINTTQGIGLADLTTGDWQRYGGGCWTSLAPDNSYLLWMFEGNHRQVTMVRPDGTPPWSVVINGGPGVDGHRVFHPRWANHPRFLAVTGPFPDGVRRGGQGVEIYLGRFSPDFTAVEDWIRISRNEHADFYPQVWVDPAVASTASLDQPNLPASAEPAANPDPEPQPEEAWPQVARDTVFLWERHNAKNELRDPDTGRRTYFSVKAHGPARFGRHFEMRPDRGFFQVPAELAQPMLARIQQAQALTMEALIFPAPDPGKARLPVMTFTSPSASPDPGLWQRGRQLVFMDTNGDEQALTSPIPASATQPVHIMLRWADGQARVAVNGKPGDSWTANLDLAALDSGTLRFGGAHDGQIWPGGVEAVRIAAHPKASTSSDQDRLPDLETIAARHFAALEQQLAARPDVEQVVVRARLKEQSPVPSPEDIAPYTRALVVNAYTVEEVLDGQLEHRDILVAHWAVMDGKVLDTARGEPGSLRRMSLHPFDQHPELAEEWQSMDVTDILLPMYYDHQS
jgi:hypothetical protein